MGIRRGKAVGAIAVAIVCIAAGAIAGCGSGGGGGGGEGITVSGKVTFDLVPESSTAGLVYANTMPSPARGIVIEALNNSSGATISSTTTDSSGAYSLASVPRNTMVKIRVKAQMLKTGSPSWDFQVVDNTSSKALYAMESAAFDSGVTNIPEKNLNAASGWGSSSYASTRVAAPFAILDTVYKSVQRILSANATVQMPQLLINWSINNRAPTGNEAIGEIGTSHYDPNNGQLYILGKENVDTDEYDDHVVAHEWGHYFEAKFSRSDSLGDDHSSGAKLDPRVAFGEGFGNGFSGMALDNPTYIDTMGAQQATIGLLMDLSNPDGDPNSIGWFSEDSVQYILYSLYKDMGFSPIYNVLVNDQKNTSAYTTIYPFIAALKTQNPAKLSFINGLLVAKNITKDAVDEWDSTQQETNDAGYPIALPINTKLTVGAAATQLCVSDALGGLNKLLVRNRVYFEIATQRDYTMSADIVTEDGVPNISIMLKGTSVGATESKTSQNVTLTKSLAPGMYSAEVYDYRQMQANTGIGEVCYNVSIN